MKTGFKSFNALKNYVIGPASARSYKIGIVDNIWLVGWFFGW